MSASWRWGLPLAAAVLISAAIGLRMRAGADPEPLEPGAPLPQLPGELLTGAAAVLPDAARGRTALLILGFTYDSRVFVDAWAKRFREAYAGDSTVTFYEIPMMGGMARLAKPFIDRGMRNGTPPELHGNVMTVWGASDEWKSRVEFRSPEDAYVILIDRNGRVAWRRAGPCEATAWERLQMEMATLGHGSAAAGTDSVAPGPASAPRRSAASDSLRGSTAEYPETAHDTLRLAPPTPPDR